MKTEIGACPECGHHALVKEKVDGVLVLNCWVCPYKIPIPDGGENPEEDQDIFDDPDYYTTSPG